MPPDDNFRTEGDRIRAAYERYSLAGEEVRWSVQHPANTLMRDERSSVLDEMLREEGLRLQDMRILDVGCGSGASLAEWLTLGAGPDRTFGTDLLIDRLAKADASVKARMVCASGHRLPFEDSSFDLISAFTMFSSILDQSLAAAVAADMARVVGGGGRIVCYDMRFPNPRNKSIRSVTTQQLRRLFPDATMRSRTLTVLPPLARRFARSTSRYRTLARLRFLNAHRLTLIDLPDR